jgi:hypothetical protein
VHVAVVAQRHELTARDERIHSHEVAARGQVVAPAQLWRAEMCEAHRGEQVEGQIQFPHLRRRPLQQGQVPQNIAESAGCGAGSHLVEKNALDAVRVTDRRELLAQRHLRLRQAAGKPVLRELAQSADMVRGCPNHGLQRNSLRMRLASKLVEDGATLTGELLKRQSDDEDEEWYGYRSEQKGIVAG